MKNRKGQAGFSLIEVLVASGLLAIVGITMVSLFQVSNQDSQQLRTVRVVTSARARIEAAMKNPVAWRQTVTNNVAFACASNATGCNLSNINDGYYDFVLYSVTPGEAVTYDPSDPRTRYALRGDACPAGVPNPDPRCPYKYQARWKPLCQSYPCTNPTLDIKVSLIMDYTSRADVINTEKYEFGSVRGVDDVSLQTACHILNGFYNVATGTCRPKNSGRTCASIGRPAQIVTAVDLDGNITCSPLYSGSCNASTQVMSGISTAGVAQCSVKTQPTNCPTPCVGAWGSCTRSCGGGVQYYEVVRPATNGGAACTMPAPGTSRVCNTGACPVNCQGSWSSCSASCGGGTRTYRITTWPSGGGASCPYNDGDTMACNTQACAVPVNCRGSWSSCSPYSGTRTFTITQAPQDGGTPCPSPLTESCPVNCVGNWSSCSSGYRTYSWTTPPMNGGSACTYRDGQTDSSGCANPVDCRGSWGSCDSSTGTRTFNITQSPRDGGAACPSPTTETCAVNCSGSWSGCSGGVKTYTWNVTPKNGGSDCAFPNGATDSSSCGPPPGNYYCSNWGGGAPEYACAYRQHICNADDAAVARIERTPCTVGETTTYQRGCDDCSSSGISGGTVYCECQ